MRKYHNATRKAVLVGLLACFPFLNPQFSFGQQSEQIKPYVLVIVDVSGSMASDVATVASCGGGRDRIDHAKCAIQQVTQAHGDIQFALSRFRTTANPSSSCSACEANTGIDCEVCADELPSATDPPECTATMNSPDRFQLLVPFVDDSTDFIAPWVDFFCGTAGCSYNPNDDPELRLPGGSSWTPIGGALRGARRFFQGNDPNITADAVDNLDAIYGAGINDPIASDPVGTVFVGPNEQCRPYVVVLLTDGEETCEVFDNPGDADDTVGAAAALLATPYNAQTYRIETRPIGFGITACDAQIEALAHAGGQIDDGNAATCEGLYANDEQGLVSAFNAIIADSIKVEVCDQVDNDCDSAIDEGYQLYCDLDGGNANQELCVDPGDDCDGIDDNCVDGIDDEPVNACGGCGPVPTEVCNNLDDDCDGQTDENGAGGNVCGSCVFLGEETCNNADEDCDGDIDENVTRACGTDLGECTAGVEQCAAGTWQNCSAVGGSPEFCDGLDNDCDGTVDGFTQECSEISANDPPYNGVCQPGTQICPVPITPGLGNAFEACLGEVGPGIESCDGLDNDCDASIDEDTGGADCSSACGLGTTVCSNGSLQCDSNQGSSEPETCNNADDDCDNIVDEDVPSGGPCTDGGLCQPGVYQCINGAYVCTGGEPPRIEICDCSDNDCDGNTDEEPPELCAVGASCVDCQCAYPCGAGEFPCPQGRYCSEGGFCLADACFNVVCSADGDGNPRRCDSETGACVPICDLTVCPSGTACRPSDGSCLTDDCRGFPERCTSSQLCVAGVCEEDPCSGVSCDENAGLYCFEGNCVGSCADVVCAAPQECQLGECVSLPCDNRCTALEVCDEASGICTDNPCNVVNCGVGQQCDPSSGDCIRDRCLGVDCPGDQLCDDGSCYAAKNGQDAGVDRDYVAPGGGGCRGGGNASGLATLLLGLALCYSRRRNASARTTGDHA